MDPHLIVKGIEAVATLAQTVLGPPGPVDGEVGPPVQSAYVETQVKMKHPMSYYVDKPKVKQVQKIKLTDPNLTKGWEDIPETTEPIEEPAISDEESNHQFADEISQTQVQPVLQENNTGTDGLNENENEIHKLKKENKVLKKELVHSIALTNRAIIAYEKLKKSHSTSN